MSDIRSFFGKPAPAKKANAEPPPKAGSEKSKVMASPKKEIAISPEKKSKSPEKKSVKSSPVKGRGSAKKPIQFDSSEDSEEEFKDTKPGKKASTPAKKPINFDTSSDSDEDNKAKTKKKTAARGKSSPASPKKSSASAKNGASSKKSTSKAKSEPGAANPALPLQNVNFVISGMFHNYTKETLKDEIMRLGGKVTTGVSGKTHYLFSGHVLEDGRSGEESKKYSVALEKNTKIMKEDEFSEFLENLKSKLPGTQSSSAKSTSSKQITTNNVQVNDDGGVQDPSMMLWVDKYKPKRIEDLVGNNSCVQSLRGWLKDWDDMHIHGAKPKSFGKNNPSAKAVLLSGPPGIGKTTAATIVSKSLGYDLLELNASDARSKNVVANTLGDAVNSTSLVGKGKKRVIIMDEVDGMSSDDRGGVQELIKLIKKSKVPIICICNDRQKSSIRSLANYCFDLRFQRPNVDSLAKRMMDIASSEGMRLEPNAIGELCRAQQRDVRQVVGALQMWGRSSTEMTYDDWVKRKKEVNKDEEFLLSNFDACRFIFNEARNPIQLDHRLNAYFIDYDLIPLMVQENYVNVCMSGRKDPLDMLKQISEASDAACDADIVSKCVRGGQNWGLLPQVGALNVRVATISAGTIGFPGFPVWLSKNSSRGKKMRLLSETAMHMRQKANLNVRTLRLEYFSTLRDTLLKPLLESNKEGLSRTIELMDGYGLDRDDVFETMQEVRLGLANPFDKIDSKIKTAFTRTYNQGTHTSQALVEEAGIVGLKRKRGRGKAGGNDDEGGDDGEEGNMDVDGDEKSEEDEMNELLKLNEPKAKKAKSSSSSSSTKGNGKGKASSSSSSRGRKKNK